MFNLSQLVNVLTRVTSSSANVLDLLLTTTPESVSSLSLLPGLSDHSAIHFTLQTSSPRLPRQYKLIRDYGKADFRAINAELAIFADAFFPQFWERSIHEDWDIFKTEVTNLADKYILLRRISCSRKSPWFNLSLKRLQNKTKQKKKRIFRRCKESKMGELWSAYLSVAWEYKKAIVNAKHAFFNNTIPSLLSTNPHKFWNVVSMREREDIRLNSESGLLIPRHQSSVLLNNTFPLFFTNCAPTALPLIRNSLFTRMEPI